MTSEVKVKARALAIRSLPRVVYGSPPPPSAEGRTARAGPLDERLLELERALEEAAERLLDSLEETVVRLVDAQVSQILKSMKPMAKGKESR